jgi:hypothetical protein
VKRRATVSAARARREARLTLDVSLSPDYVAGTVKTEDGTATTFEGWLGLAQAVATSAGAGSSPIPGPALLGEQRPTTTGTDRGPAATPRKAAHRAARPGPSSETEGRFDAG